MPEPKFKRGDLVRHKRLNYRGVIYEIRLLGNPDDNWQSPSESVEDNETAWYRILVHGAQRSSDAAEHELVPDLGGEQVVNPRVKDMFECFTGGRYKPRVI